VIHLLDMLALEMLRLREHFVDVWQHQIHLEQSLPLDYLRIALQQRSRSVDIRAAHSMQLEYLGAAREQAIALDFLQQVEHLKIAL
jgi:hypothetical protein